MSIHIDRVSFESLRLHNVEAVSLGPVERMPGKASRAAFFTRDLTIAMSDGQSVTIELFADDADSLAVADQEAS